MVRTMYDGVTPASVPAGAALYAGYDDGAWQSFAALVAAFPAARHVSICVTATGRAQVLDIESGDATPAQAPGWAEDMRRSGIADPCCYMNESTWTQVQAEFAAQNVAAPLYWVASYVTDPAKVPAIPAGAIALQYYDFGGYDASAVADYWPGVDPAPESPQEDDEMPQYMTETSVNGRVGLLWNGGAITTLEAQYAGAGPLELDIELKFATGPWYSADNGGPWQLTEGSGTWKIPSNLVGSCRGVIVTPHAGSPTIEYDVLATY